MICKFCNGDITKTIGCTLPVFLHKGNEYKRFIVGGSGDFFEDDSAGDDARCGDCGSKYRHYHYNGCDCERCPYAKVSYFPEAVKLCIKLSIRSDTHRK